MPNDHPKVYLFIHVILRVYGHTPLLSRPVRKVLPAQNLSQVVNSIRTSSSLWLNENKLLAVPFAWEEGYAAHSVSPGSVRQVIGFIDRQEEVHKTKTLETEMEVFKTPL